MPEDAEMKSVLVRMLARFDLVGIRLAVVLAVALLPLMIVSILRSQSVLDEAQARSQAALIGETLRAVQEEIIIIERAKAVAQSLSHSTKVVLADAELCNHLMLQKIRDTPFSFAGFYDTKGDVPCSSARTPFSFGMSPELAEQVKNPRPTVRVNENAPKSGASVIFASHPVHSDAGELLGFTSVSVPHRKLRQVRYEQIDASVLTLNASGTILTAPESLEQAALLLPRLDKDQILSSEPQSFRATDQEGNERLYAVVPIVDRGLYALSTWPLDQKISGSYYLKTPWLFPALMWLASLAVAWFAASLFVTRHVLKLREAMQGFTTSRRRTAPEAFQSAPRELRDVSDTFMLMTDKILRDEAELEDTVHQKDVLLREVHHRVKNNLQLIASIMSLQMRQSNSPDVKRLMQSLHDRVTSLATIHRDLYQTSGQADIRMDEHLNTIVRQVVNMAAARVSSIELRTDLDALRLNPDQAVPLSLFVTEATTNALKYIGGADRGNRFLAVSLKVISQDRAELVITNSVGPDAAEPDGDTSSGLGSELMEAFAMQLSGSYDTAATAQDYKVTLDFEVEPLTAKP